MSSHPDTLEGMFAARVAADPSRPLITFYDDATGERAELSAKSLANWVAKTHYLITDELGYATGDRAFVRLPVHWLAAPILLGCWFAGLHVVSDPGVADVVFSDTASLPEFGLADSGLGDASGFAEQFSAAEEIFVVSLLSMARSGEPPPGLRDYANAVRPQPDSWPGVHPQAGPDDLALDGVTRGELLADAAQAATSLGLQAGGRLLWTRPWTTAADWVPSLLAPLAVTASIVLVGNCDPAAIAGKVRGERPSVTV